MASKLDELPVVWLVVLLDDPPSMNDIHLGTIGFEFAMMNSIEIMVFVES
jgi:hypothetical protein